MGRRFEQFTAPRGGEQQENEAAAIDELLIEQRDKHPADFFIAQETLVGRRSGIEPVRVEGRCRMRLQRDSRHSTFTAGAPFQEAAEFACHLVGTVPGLLRLVVNGIPTIIVGQIVKRLFAQMT